VTNHSRAQSDQAGTAGRAPAEPACSLTPTELAAAAEALGLEKYRRHIFLCADQTEPKCAARDQGLAGLVQAKSVQNHGQWGKDPIIARHKPPPGRGVPPDVLGAKAFEAERGVENEPEEVLENPEED
jgi:hypothetical protein